MSMTVNEGLRTIAGLFILISVALAVWVSPWFLAFTAFVGLNLLQSGFSHTCPMMAILRRAGCPDDARPDRPATDRTAPPPHGARG